MSATAKKTDPKLWEQVKQEITKGTKGGKAGQWSARKAQLAAQEYQKRGGGYAGGKRDDNALQEWSDQQWDTRSGRPSGETGERYLPKDARDELSDDDYQRTSRKKRQDSQRGHQRSRQPADVARKTASARRSLQDMTKDELMERAARRQVRGRSRMNKDELIHALHDTGEQMTSKTASASDKKELRNEFKQAVNMTPAQLRKWLSGDTSKTVGMTKGGKKVKAANDGQAVGHGMGERILELKGKRQAELEEDDYKAMRKVIGYVHRHLKQRPDGDIADSRWRKSLMNWGHDPMREKKSA